MSRNFRVTGKLKWISENYSEDGTYKLNTMFIPPTLKNFDKNIRFINFEGDVAKKIFQNCSTNNILEVRGKYTLKGNRVKYLGQSFKKLFWNQDLDRYVCTFES